MLVRIAKGMNGAMVERVYAMRARHLSNGIQFRPT